MFLEPGSLEITWNLLTPSLVPYTMHLFISSLCNSFYSKQAKTSVFLSSVNSSNKLLNLGRWLWKPQLIAHWLGVPGFHSCEWQGCVSREESAVELSPQIFRPDPDSKETTSSWTESQAQQGPVLEHCLFGEWRKFPTHLMSEVCCGSKVRETESELVFCF